MDNETYTFIHDIVDELLVNILKTISQKSSDVKKINAVTRCNNDAIFKQFKVHKINYA